MKVHPAHASILFHDELLADCSYYKNAIRVTEDPIASIAGLDDRIIETHLNAHGEPKIYRNIVVLP